MRHFKSERLKKLESELKDLQQWMKLGLVPKKDLVKHQEEIVAVQAKIDEEKERLQFLKESGDWEEYVTPKRTPGRAGYTEMPTIPDLGTEMDAGSSGMTEEYDNDETENSRSHNFTEEEGGSEETEETSSDTESSDSYFGRRTRWRDIVDPDAEAW